ncbi:SGNH/GDSL hydrolase family protein [Ramlibacter sp.]|uniref:SGNH/GDSL hydrolase family protein n=1 Tax=Ramlibacter sp. TaxID=1917967 RepID=UPI0017D2C95E|nr:SGNH/GDSL hydrolase family protein [Ramlibacter sp.]MBA2676318.1 SGNH/GDSL hydrolase family protein [Ramlibacter sp.]
MKQILVYSDSVGWGMVPGTRERFPFDQRWPGVLENALDGLGAGVRVIENSLAGRKTVWDDPWRPGRNGAVGLAEVIEINSPLALVVIQLGTNDFQAPHDIPAWASAAGVGRLVDIIRQAPIEPGMPRPGILVLVPPDIVEPKGANVLKFQGAPARSKGFGDALKAMAEQKQVGLFDLNRVTAASTLDGIHLDRDQHAAIGQALAPVVARMLAAA